MLDPLPLSIALFVLIALVVGVDAASDYAGGVGAEHLLTELVAGGLALAGALVTGQRLRRLQRRKAELDEALSASERTAEQWKADAERATERWRVDAERWKRDTEAAVGGLAQAIDAEFRSWKLSPAECAVGLLLLKGLSHKEIAELRGVSDRTVRQQARVLYGKAGLSGRADLAAYFLEDLLSPERRGLSPSPTDSSSS